MGRLQRTTQDAECWLSGRVLVGRAPTCRLRIRDKRVSGEHARVEFRAGAWQVRDLGSRNGTLVNGSRLASGQTLALKQGDALSFGSAAEAWVLVDAGPPVALAVGDDGTVLRAEDGFLAIPGDSVPEVYAYTGEDGDWFAEAGEQLLSVSDQQQLSAAGRVWTLHLPGALAATWAPQSGVRALGELSMHFTVSPDEEYVTVTLRGSGREDRLPSRAHDYMLLTLARARLADRGAGISAAEAGWLHTDTLCQMLRVDGNKLGVDIFRARKAVAALGIHGAAGLIERRRTTRQVRIGVAQLSTVVG